MTVVEPVRLRPVSPMISLDTLEHELMEARDQRRQVPLELSEKDIGRLSAEAVLGQYEAAAKSVEGMGDEIKDRIKKLEGALVEADKDLKLVAEAAAAIREKGRLVQIQIEEASGVSQDIRTMCTNLRKKIGLVEAGHG